MAICTLSSANNMLLLLRLHGAYALMPFIDDDYYLLHEFNARMQHDMLGSFTLAYRDLR